MAIPVISNTTSILGYRKGEYFEYQPYASETPTGWTATGLPDGITINATTGRISGAATDPGVFLVSLKASNATGTSAAQVITLGIEDGVTNDSVGIEVNIDTRTGFVSVPGIDSSTSKAILFAKLGDMLFLDVGFWKDGMLQDLPIGEIRFQLREFDGETVLVESNGTVENIGSFTNSRYRIAVDFNSQALRDVLGNYEGSYRTGFLAIAELQWTVMFENPVVWGGFDHALRSSQTFRVVIDRDLIAH